MKYIALALLILCLSVPVLAFIVAPKLANSFEPHPHTMTHVLRDARIP